MMCTREDIEAAKRWEGFLRAAAGRHPRAFVREHGVAMADRLRRAREDYVPELSLRADGKREAA